MTRKRDPSSRQPKRPSRKPVEDEPVLTQEFDRPIKLARRNWAFRLVPNREPSVEGDNFEVVDAEFSEIEGGNELEYRKLKSDIVALLEQKLRDGGLSEPNAALLAHATMHHFQKVDDLSDPQQAAIAVDLAVALLRGVDTLTAEFNAAAEPARPKWIDRDPDKFPTAESFLRHYFGPRLGIEGDLTQAALGKIDGRLLAALDAEFRGERRSELRALLPTTKERNDALLLRMYGYIPEGEDRKKKVTVLARHKP